MWSALLLCWLAQPLPPLDPTPSEPSAPLLPKGTVRRIDFRVASGAELDTNARRAVPGTEGDPLANASRPTQVVADGLGRLLVDGLGTYDWAPGHRSTLNYTLGAKRFFQESTEDLLAHDLAATTQHAVASSLAWTASGNFRASRIRGGIRDYNLGQAGTSLVYQLASTLILDLGGQLNRFLFMPEPRFDYWGARAGLGVQWAPKPRFSLSARADHAWRWYEGNALVVGQSTVARPDGSFVEILTFCDNPVYEAMTGITCSPRLRRDRELQLALGAQYRGRFVLGGQYLLRRQRSTSDVEDIDRHRLSAQATFLLPAELTGSVIATLQINRGRSVTDTKFLAEDDENQNSLQAQIRRRFTDQISLELRYALFANQFSTAQASFLRQTVYLGLSFRTALTQ